MTLQEIKDQIRSYMALRKVSYRKAGNFNNKWTPLNGDGDIKAETFFSMCDSLRILPLQEVSGEHHIFTHESLVEFFSANQKTFRKAQAITEVENNRIRLWRVTGGKGMSIGVSIRIMEKMGCSISGFVPMEEVC